MCKVSLFSSALYANSLLLLIICCFICNPGGGAGTAGRIKYTGCNTCDDRGLLTGGGGDGECAVLYHRHEPEAKRRGVACDRGIWQYQALLHGVYIICYTPCTLYIYSPYYFLRPPLRYREIQTKFNRSLRSAGELEDSECTFSIIEPS